MERLTHDDMLRIVGRMPRDVVALMKERGCILGGGYIRARVAGEEPSDIDLFSPSVDAAEVSASRLADGRSVKVYRTRNAFSVLTPNRIAVQFIHRWQFSDADALIRSFDFTVAQAAIWWAGEEWHSITSTLFYADLAAKRLRYLRPDRHEDAGGSLLRVQKFLHRGYNISPEDLAAVIARLFSGVKDSGLWASSGEEGRTKVLAGLLRQVDPLAIIDGLEPTDDSLEEAPMPTPPPLAPIVPPVGPDIDF